MEKGNDVSDSNSRLRVYAAITLAIVMLAIASYLIVPNQGTMGGCMGLALAESRYACINNLAVSSVNASMCGSLSGYYADSCYANVAHASGKGQDCIGIANLSKRSMCMTAIALSDRNYSMCGSAVEPLVSQCEDKVALVTHNGSLCEGIANATYKDHCVSITNARLAFSTYNSSYCQKVSNSTDKDFAETIIGNFSYGALPGASINSTILLSSLAFLPNMTYTARDFCYMTLALGSKNYSICSMVSEGTARSLCSYRSATTSTNASSNYTQLIQNCAQTGSFAQQCVSSILLSQAVNTRNSTLCGQLLDTSLQVNCFSLLASTYKNSTYCGYISDAMQRNSCMNSSQ
jgi:hypothetical protein